MRGGVGAGRRQGGDLDRHETIQNLIAANSGGPPLARAQTATDEQWATAVQRSLLFFARMSREALPHLKRQGAGRIINFLASTVYQPIPNLALSGATRMGVVAFAKSLADEVGRARAKELGISVERDERAGRRLSGRGRRRVPRLRTTI